MDTIEYYANNPDLLNWYYDNNPGLLNLLKGEHLVFPTIDRTPFYICLSTIFCILACYLIYRAIRIKTFVSKPPMNNNGVEKKRSKTRICLKIILILSALALIFFSVVSKREIHLICPRCMVSYTYNEYRVFGKIVYLNNFTTYDPPQNILFKKEYLGRNVYCGHHFDIEHRIKYWGCLIPTIEQYYGNITWGISDGTTFDEPYQITNKYQMIDARDETGYHYHKVYELNHLMEQDGKIQLKSDLREEQESQQQPDELEVEQENMETSEQIQEVEPFGNNSFGNLDNFKLKV
ncbi:MAG: hypothetical protein LBJ67_04210 [Planctomycetaceae bacterium]|jgi:hypothetical protein|nr:hypothetical protein [Planctomycetaceae bacterium]